MYKTGLVFIAAAAGMFLFGICLITLGAVATELKAKYSLNGVAAGTLFAILPVGIFTGSLVFGPVCDRYGYKLLLMLACVGMFAGFEGIAFANSLSSLKLSIFIFGVGGGIINGATNALVADISEAKKGANLSLLGVFFGIGALGMPLLMGMLSDRFRFLQIVAFVGWITLIVGLFYAFVTFPPAKQPQSSDSSSWKNLFHPLLLVIAFFLFFQSSLEAIINNWTTTYLADRGVMTERVSLYALSLHIVGMVVMRLLTGTVLRSVSLINIMWICLIMLTIGILLMQLGKTQGLIVVGLFLSGAGLAGGFPIMLGFVGERFAAISGTAFSFVFTVALIGNMMINYLTGLIVHRYGVQHFTTVSYIQIAIMAILFIFIIKKLKLNTK